FHEEDRRRLRRVTTHLAYVLGVVESDAVDAMHREAAAAGDVHARYRGGREDELAHAELSCCWVQIATAQTARLVARWQSGASAPRPRPSTSVPATVCPASSASP